MKLEETKTALVLGTFAAVVHIVWSLMVFLGLAEGYINWILGLHFLSNPYRVMPFNLTTAIILVAFTFIIGYILGYVFAVIWNRLHTK